MARIIAEIGLNKVKINRYPDNTESGMAFKILIRLGTRNNEFRSSLKKINTMSAIFSSNKNTLLITSPAECSLLKKYKFKDKYKNNNKYGLYSINFMNFIVSEYSLTD